MNSGLVVNLPSINQRLLLIGGLASVGGLIISSDLIQNPQVGKPMTSIGLVVLGTGILMTLTKK